MTPLQLLPFKKYFPAKFLTKDERYPSTYLSNHFNFIYGNKALLVLTFGFILFKANNFLSLGQRPALLFLPENYFGQVLMPHLPGKETFLLIAFLALISCIYLFLSPNQFWIRLGLTFSLLWLNLAQWSYGVFSHVAHLLLLAHLFSIFIIFRITKNRKEAAAINQSIIWYYGGLLLTYTLSGIWKWLGLFYKLLLKPGDIHWLHPDASLFNAVISFHSYDLPFGLQPIFSFPFIWQAGFVLMLLIQTFCILAVFTPQGRCWIGLALIIFHLINAVAFATVFLLAPAVIACLFFPYHTLLKTKYKQYNQERT